MAFPQGITITLTTGGVAYSLLERLVAAAPKIMSSLAHVQGVDIQADVDGGSTRYYQGGANLATNMAAKVFFATQVLSLELQEGDVLSLADIYVMASASSATMNVMPVFRGVKGNPQT